MLKVLTASSVCMLRKIKCEAGKCDSEIPKGELRLKFTQAVRRSGKHFLRSRKESGGARTELSGPGQDTVGEKVGWNPAATAFGRASLACCWLGEGAI